MRFLILLLICIFAKQSFNSATARQVEDNIGGFTYVDVVSPKHPGIFRLFHSGYMCSAVVVSPQYALTAAHCAVGFSRFMYQGSVAIHDVNDNDTGVHGKFVALDHDLDVAVLKADFRDFQEYKINTAFNPKIGEKLRACGFPDNANFTCNEMTFEGNYSFQWFMYGAPLQHGQSGGPVFNTDNEVVAVNSAVAQNGSILAPIVGLEGIW